MAPKVRNLSRLSSHSKLDLIGMLIDKLETPDPAHRFDKGTGRDNRVGADPCPVPINEPNLLTPVAMIVPRCDIRIILSQSAAK